MTEMPVAYEGKEPYIFISYAHKNTDRVMPIIAELQNRGFRVWYDAGIEAGTEWPEYIAEHLVQCGCFVAMLTQDALESHNCRREIHFAISKQMPVLVVYLEEVKMTAGMEMQLGVLQAIFYNRHSDLDSFMGKLCESALLLPCKGSVGAEPFERVPTAQELYDQGKAAEARKDYAEAVRLFRLAAEQNHAAAQCKLGDVYFCGWGVSKDYAEAVRWFRLAAEQGFAHAQNALGDRYYYGQGVSRDYAEAVRWYRRAADQNHAGAQCKLGKCYSYGIGVSCDEAEAVRWYRRAADQNHAEAQFWLGHCYHQGLGVCENRAEAVHWYRLAAANRSALAQARLDELE